jgi:hypothetical protein
LNATQELPTLPVNLTSHVIVSVISICPIFSVLSTICLYSVPVLFGIALSVLLFMVSDYHFGILKLLHES